MFNFSFGQHTKILGFALLGYGSSIFISNLGPMSIWMNAPRQSREALGTEVQIYLPLLLSLGAFWSATVVLSSAFREVLNTKSVIAALAFVFIAATFFPVGTFLSAYLLIYVFVIHPQNATNEEKATTSESNEDDTVSSFQSES